MLQVGRLHGSMVDVERRDKRLADGRNTVCFHRYQHAHFILRPQISVSNDEQIALNIACIVGGLVFGVVGHRLWSAPSLDLLSYLPNFPMKTETVTIAELQGLMSVALKTLPLSPQ